MRAGPHQGPTQLWGCCESNHWANYLRRGGKGGGGAREEADFIMKVLMTITFCPLRNLGLPSCSTVSEKARGWERKDLRQEATDSSLIMRQGFPELTSSPTLPPHCRHTTECWYDAPLMKAGNFSKHRRSCPLGTFPAISTPKSHTGS